MYASVRLPGLGNREAVVGTWHIPLLQLDVWTELVGYATL